MPGMHAHAPPMQGTHEPAAPVSDSVLGAAAVFQQLMQMQQQQQQSHPSQPSQPTPPTAQQQESAQPSQTQQSAQEESPPSDHFGPIEQEASAAAAQAAAAATAGFLPPAMQEILQAQIQQQIRQQLHGLQQQQGAHIPPHQAQHPQHPQQPPQLQQQMQQEVRMGIGVLGGGDTADVEARLRQMAAYVNSAAGICATNFCMQHY
jgi:hypothetical protein